MDESMISARQRRRGWAQSAVSLLLFLALSAAASTLRGDEGDGFKQALGPREWAFPRDHGKHEGYKVEWWYFTGNLWTRDGRRFGYQLTFFRSELQPPTREAPPISPGPAPTTAAATQPDSMASRSPWATRELYLAHLAISDVKDRQFHFRDVLSRGREGLAGASDRTMDVNLRDWSARIIDGTIRLKGSADDMELNLTCPKTPAVMEGPGGLSRKGKLAGQASYYYSMPRLTTSGTLRVKDQTFQVEGLSWMDHEFSSNFLSQTQQGWDWISLHLDDHRSLMLYRLRNRDGTDFRFGTLISKDGTPAYIDPRDIQMVPSQVHKSPLSGAEYPMRWTIEVPGTPRMEIRPTFPDQELRTDMTTKVTYFEGCMDAVDPAGTRIGTGYLEMTGYAPAK